MTLHQLRIVLSIAKHRSITRGSEEHHVSQPSGSQQIRLLEQEYGIKLYVKNGNGIEFTPAGQKFIASAKQILSQVDKLEKECKGILSHPNGNSITVGAAYHTSVPRASHLGDPVRIRFARLPRSQARRRRVCKE